MGLLDKSINKDNSGGGFQGKFKQVFELAKPSLNLSAPQQAEIVEIFKEFKEERADIKAIPGISHHDEIRDARKDAKEQILAVLTPEQRQIFHANIDKWRAQIG